MQFSEECGEVGGAREGEKEGGETEGGRKRECVVFYKEPMSRSGLMFNRSTYLALRVLVRELWRIRYVGDKARTPLS